MPLRANWGFNNRTVAVCIPCSDADNYHLDTASQGQTPTRIWRRRRWPGIVHGLDGNGAREEGKPLPLRQCEALALFAGDARLWALLGERFCRLFHTCKAAELSQFERRVTATEIDWMLNNA